MSLTQKLLTKFRQQCESIATELRAILNLRAFDPLPATLLAKHLEARIFTPEEIPNILEEQVGVLLNSDQWSAAGFGQIHFGLCIIPVMLRQGNSQT